MTRRLDEIASGEVHELIGAAEHVGRELRDGGEYGRWLQDSFAPLKVSDDSVIRALAGLRAPIATTNYDNLIEQVTGLGAVTWRDTARFGRVARGELTGVLHLHGYYEDPESVVFGIRDYEQVLRDEHAQAVQQAFTLMRTLLLVGFGGGFDDPNFEELRKWMGKALHGSDHRHYRLALDGEVAALQRLHRHERIFALGYGPSHADLAPFLSALAPSRPPPIEVPPEPPPPPPPTPGPSPPPSPEPSTHRPVVAAVAVALRRRVGGRRRSVPAWALLALVVALVGGLLVARAVTPGLGSTVGACAIPLELIVLTTPTKEARLRELAVDFGDQAPGPCRRSSITVFSVPSSSAVVGALAAGWPPDDLRLGPQPAVWLPDAAAEVERVNQELGGQKLASLGSIATSAVVLAVPRSAMAKLGQASGVAWPTMVDWARRAAPDSRVRIRRPDPTSSTAGLLATIGLHGTATRSATSDAQRHAVEQTIDPVGDELTGLCEVAGEGGGPSRAVIVPEQAMVAYNRGVDFGGPCQPGQPRASDQLQAVYPADGTPVLDHPFVLLPAAVETGDRERLARDFFAYVMSAPAQRKLREAGYRDRDRRFGETISEDDGVRIHQLPRWAAAPDGATLAGQLDAWQRARVPARALLAMDVSGSMSEELPGPGGRRITAARQAAAQAVRLMGGKDHVGLWRFSQRLDGPRDYQELVALGRADGQVAGRRRSDQVLSKLAGLEATRWDTGLYDTMVAGIGRLRAAGGTDSDAVDALVVVTDGQNDDPGGASLDAVLDRLHTGDEVLVFLLTFGPARCDTGELGVLTHQRELVRCLDAGRIGLEPAFEQVAATLWGTGRLAPGGGG